jgi:hypothetical protein
VANTFKHPVLPLCSPTIFGQTLFVAAPLENRRYLITLLKT